MKAWLDYHVHTTFSPDGQATMEEQCRRAVEIGLQEVAFTEHLDLQPDDPFFGFYNREAYDAEFERCQALFEGRLSLRRGLEVTYQQEFHDQIVNRLTGYPYDFVIGSVHVILAEPLFDEALYRRYSPLECYTLYYQELERAARSGLFSSLGHLDLPKRYSHHIYGDVPWTGHRELVERVLRAAVGTGTGIEINTSGLASGAAETFPPLDVVALYRELGGEILTVGSDAHRTAQLGFCIDTALDMARAAGFKAVATFEHRQPHLVPLE